MAKITIDKKFKKLIQRELVVFDFDETIINCNSDTWIHQLAPGQKLPEHVEYRHGQDYFKYVQSVLSYLHEQRVSKEQITECLSRMPSVEGILDPLISTLAKQTDKYDMIILSDANSYFISSYLKCHQLEGVITTVLTNPARFTDDDLLIIDEYHIQDYCSMSARNLCKGEALKNFIGKRMLDHNTVYTCVNYVGDGENDLCPSTKLSNRDRVFPREGYSLARLCARLKASSSSGHVRDSGNSELNKLPELKATIVPWTSGEDILRVITGESTPV